MQKCFIVKGYHSHIRINYKILQVVYATSKHCDGTIVAVYIMIQCIFSVYIFPQQWKIRRSEMILLTFGARALASYPASALTRQRPRDLCAVTVEGRFVPLPPHDDSIRQEGISTANCWNRMVAWDRTSSKVKVHGSEVDTGLEALPEWLSKVQNLRSLR